MLANYDWRSRHPGSMAIVAIGEGTGKVGMRFVRFLVVRSVIIPFFFSFFFSFGDLSVLCLVVDLFVTLFVRSFFALFVCRSGCGCSFVLAGVGYAERAGEDFRLRPFTYQRAIEH